MPLRKWRGNTRRENRLEELGRVDAEKAYTSKGKKNLKQEKSRIRKELATGGRPSLGSGQGMDPKDLQRKLTPRGQRRKAGPKAARPVPKSLRDRLKEYYRRGKQSPGRPGGKGPKPDKRWNKGDKFMTPLKFLPTKSEMEAARKMIKSGKPKLARKGWK